MKKPIKLKWMPVIRAIIEDDQDCMMREIMTMPETKAHITNLINDESDKICTPATKSTFRDSSSEGLSKFNFQTQLQEMEKYAPTLLHILQTSATSTHIFRNKLKTTESLTPAIMTAASILFNCRSQEMNAQQVMTGLTVLEGGCSKLVFQRLNARSLSSAYETVIKKQSMLGERFDGKVKEWARRVQRANERNLDSSTCSTEGLEGTSTSADETSCNMFQLVMDNVDMTVRTRHTSRERHGFDYHMVNVMAVKDRVTSPPNYKPSTCVTDTELGTFLPSISDNNILKNNWAVLIGHIIANHIPALGWMKQELPEHIHHRYMSEAKQKSEVVSKALA